MASEETFLELEEEQKALLRTEGVMGKGYGLIPKLVMVDPGLSITAKAIYAYLCSLAGAGQTAFPSRNNITHTLGINKDTFYKHFKGLQERQLLLLQQSRAKGSKFGHNIYIIATHPPQLVHNRGSGKYQSPFQDPELDQPPSQTPYSNLVHTRLSSEGIRSAGYGMLPRQVMQDLGLSATAKAIYAYICSFAGAGQTAFPAQGTMLYHLGISAGTYRKAVKQLTEAQYLAIKQRREHGQFTICEFFLLDDPPPGTKISDTVEPDTEKSDTKPSDAAGPDTVEPDITINSPITNSSIKNSSSSNSPSISYPEWRLIIDQEPESLPDIIHQIDRRTVKSYIGQYLGLDIMGICKTEEIHNKVLYLTDLVAEALFYPSLKVSDQVIAPEQFIPKLLNLSLDEYQWVLERVGRVKGIRNLKAYYLASLYRAHEDMAAALDQEAAADLN